MFHQLLQLWFNWVHDWGYWGVFCLMALESSIVPIPSEIILPPAAFWASQGKMNFSGVVLAGTAGSYLGSALSYWAAAWFGRPILTRYGKFFLLTASKLELAEHWIARFGPFGVFVARLLPVIRHLISLPAGLLKMPFGKFSVATIVGAFTWCWLLSWFGSEIIGANPTLLSNPETLWHGVKQEMGWYLAAPIIMVALYLSVVFIQSFLANKAADEVFK